MADKELTWGEVAAIAREAATQYRAFEKIDQAASAAVILEDSLNKAKREYLDWVNKINDAKAQLDTLSHMVEDTTTTTNASVDTIKMNAEITKQAINDDLAKLNKELAFLRKVVADMRVTSAAEVEAIKATTAQVQRQAEAEKRETIAQWTAQADAAKATADKAKAELARLIQSLA